MANSDITDVLTWEGSINPNGGKWRAHQKLVFTCLADDGDGSFPVATISTANLPKLLGTYLSRVYFKQGSLAPTADTDVTITDEYGFDLLGGLGVDAIDATGDDNFVPMVNAFNSPHPLYGDLSLTITNNAVLSATFSFIFISFFPAVTIYGIISVSMSIVFIALANSKEEKSYLVNSIAANAKVPAPRSAGLLVVAEPIKLLPTNTLADAPVFLRVNK